MKKIILPFFLSGLLGMASFSANGWVIPTAPLLAPMPPGNYSQTCSSCSVSGQNMLNCACADSHGLPHNTTLSIPRNCNYVENINGVLQCTQQTQTIPTAPSDQQNTRYFNIPVASIWNQLDANAKCPQACENNQAIWTGKWRVIPGGKIATCLCRLQWNPHRKF